MQIFRLTMLEVKKNIGAFVATALLLVFSSTIAVFAQTNQSGDAPTAVVNRFYRALLERRLRDALLMTNLRFAVEPLSNEEMLEFNQSLEPFADRASGVQATGEKVSGNLASVFVKGTDPKTNQPKLDEVKLRQENGAWTILLGDAETEAVVRREGKNYLPKVRLENTHTEVDLTLQDVIAAQLAYSLKNNGLYADLQTLVRERLMPAEILNPETVGYKYRLQLSANKKKYTVSAEPLVYGKTGKLSFLLDSAGKNGSPRIQNADKNGAPVTAK